jgi:hypothetical protein
MKKLYTLLASLFILNSFAQSVTSSTLVNGNFGSASTVFATDVDKINAYYYKPYPFTLKKIASNNTESVFLSNSDYCLIPGIAIKGNKAIISTPSLFGGPTKVYLFNGANKDSITLATNLGSCYKKYPVNPVYGYFNDSSGIYKTNYTTAGTSTIVPRRTKTIIRSILEKNDKLITVEAIKNVSGNNYDRNYLYYYDGTSYTKFDSIINGISDQFLLFKNPGNNDIYAIRQYGSDTLNNRIWKFNGTTAPTLLNTSRKINVTAFLNDKIIGIVGNGVISQMVSFDLNTNTLTYVTAGSFLNANNYDPYTTNWYSNGNVAYFIHKNGINNTYAPCITNGITADTISTKNIISFPSNSWSGQFCGDDFWALVGVDDITILKPNKTFIKLAVNTSTIISSYREPTFADNHMYFKRSSASASIYELYKAACGSAIGINELATNAISFKVYPNPASDNLNIELESFDKPTIITVSNVLGKVVLTETITFSTSLNTSTQNSKLNIQNLNAGVYFLQVGNSKAIKFIKE